MKGLVVVRDDVPVHTVIATPPITPVAAPVTYVDPIARGPLVEDTRPLATVLRLVPLPPDPDPTLEPDELVDEDLEASDDDDPTPSTEVEAVKHKFESTGLAPLDAVLGGGIVVGAVILLVSPPGSGKTSLALQALVGLGHRCLYVSAEETKAQLAVAAHRVQAVSPNLLLMHAQNIEKIFRKARKFNVRTIAFDSIQKMTCDDVSGRPGTPTQLKECSERIRKFAKDTETSVVLICHIRSDGDIQGPKTIEHDADVVIELVPGPKFEGTERILTCPTGKNRFGATNVVGRFCMTETGLAPVDPDGWDEKL